MAKIGVFTASGGDESAPLGVLQAAATGLTFGSNVAAAAAEVLTAAVTNCREVVIQADPDNTEALFVGDAASQPIQLNAGMSLTIAARRADGLFIRSVGASAVANFILLHE